MTPVEALAPRRRLAMPRPDAGLLLGLGFAIFLLANASHLLRDPDTQWHIAVGRWIATHAAVPRTDIFSHTFAGAPWIAKEWLSQLLLFGLYRAGGWWAVAVASAAVIAGCFAALFVWLRQRMRPSAALAATLIAFLLYEPHFLARPHILVLPVILAWMVVVVGAADRATSPPAWAAGLMVLWTNMHGSFPLGLVMAGVVAMEAVAFASGTARWLACRRWAAFLALATAATMISPFGWRAILVPLEMSGNADTLRYVDEWRPLGFDAMGMLAMAALLATVCILASDRRRSAFRLIAVFLLTYLMIRHARFVGLFGVFAPLLAARAIGRLCPPTSTGSGGPLDAVMARGALVALASGLAVLLATVTPRPDPAVTPAAAYAVAVAHGLSGPVYNDYDFGGFLIAHDVKTFVDGRTDQLFLGSFLPTLSAAITNVSPKPFASLLDRYAVTWAITAASSPTDARLSAMPGWSVLFRDEVAAVFVRDAVDAQKVRDDVSR